MRLYLMILATVAATAVSASASAEMATFSFPLNLTNLSPSVYKVKAGCILDGKWVGFSEWYEVVNGSVTANVEVKVQLPDPRGTSMSWSCGLIAVDLTYREVELPVTPCESMPAFCIRPTPEVYRGSFEW